MGGAPTITGIFSERVVVGVGDLAVSNNPSVTLSTYALGSCVGVIAYDPEAAVAGLLHLMLPDSSLTAEKARSQPSMFADTGLAELFKSLSSLRVQKARLRVFLAGGANVLSGSDFFKIGERNVAACRKILREQRVSIVAEEVGGLNNRSIHFNLGTAMIDMKLPGGKKQISLR